MFLDSIIRLADDKVCASNDVIQAFHTDFCQVFAYFLRQEREEVHQILAASAEAFAQFFVLCRHPYGAGVLVTFAHHYATQYNQGTGGETEFFGSEHCHQYDVTACFELSVHLQHHLSAQAVQHQCLLRFAQTEFGRDAGIADG